MASASPPPPPMPKCLACGTPLQFVTPEMLGARGTDLPFFSEFFQYGQQMQPIVAYVCPSCRRLELRLR